jgi:pimeloyl-ACP methyl ester carboxylesterase
MPKTSVNGIEIEYETFGEGEPMLLIMGLGMQLIAWPDQFCSQLVDRGYQVIRFDNRDVGLSTIFDEAGVPDAATIEKAMTGAGEVRAPYNLSDMAADAAGLVDELGIDSAHVVGLSMGGMIGQTLAIEHPLRVRTLTSIMSSTGDPALPPPSPKALQMLIATPPEDIDGVAEHVSAMFEVIGSPGYPQDREMVAALARIAYERCYAPAGTTRQFLAVSVSGSRKDKLATVTVPTLVLHGEDDPLVPLECGVATAAAISGARLHSFPGMGHDLPQELWPEFIDEIDAHAKSVAESTADSA